MGLWYEWGFGFGFLFFFFELLLYLKNNIFIYTKISLRKFFFMLFGVNFFGIFFKLFLIVKITSELTECLFLI